MATVTTPRTALLVGAGLLALAARPANAQSPECAEPNVLILLDVSGSMGRANSTPPSKYDLAQQAIHQVTQNTEADVRYGLEVFPSPGAYPVYCNTSTELLVPFATYNWQVLWDYLSPTLYGSSTANPEFFGGPRSDYDTPMYQALDAARQAPGLLDPGRRNYVLLITDGVQDCCHSGDYDSELDCNPGEPYGSSNYFVPAEYEENRSDLIALVTQISAANIATFVVGFGAKVDAQALDGLALAGKTARPGCQQVGDCYYQADDGAQLTAALAQIAQVVREEVCDGLDNDCDGQADELLDRPCNTACGGGWERCVLGRYLDCDAPAPQPEACDGVDNDCDGQVDEGCPCVHGEQLPCGVDTGACTAGTQTCDHGAWGACVGASGPRVEACDGLLDEDCDGLTDEDCKCIEGETSPCGSTVGACELGAQTCVNGTWGPCLGGVRPTLGDECDGVDNDCDGLVDEYCSCIDGQVRACGSSQGVCSPGVQECFAGQWSACAGEIAGGPELCDNLDNDCDGQVDDGAICGGLWDCRCGTCVGPCGANDSCSNGGLCIGGLCVLDSCPAGSYCDGYLCIAGDPPMQDGPGGQPERGVPSEGCGCASGPLSGAHFLLLLPWLLLRRRSSAR